MMGMDAACCPAGSMYFYDDYETGETTCYNMHGSETGLASAAVAGPVLFNEMPQPHGPFMVAMNYMMMNGVPMVGYECDDSVELPVFDSMMMDGGDDGGAAMFAMMGAMPMYSMESGTLGEFFRYFGDQEVSMQAQMHKGCAAEDEAEVGGSDDVTVEEVPQPAMVDNVMSLLLFESKFNPVTGQSIIMGPSPDDFKSGACKLKVNAIVNSPDAESEGKGGVVVEEMISTSPECDYVGFMDVLAKLEEQMSKMADPLQVAEAGIESSRWRWEVNALVSSDAWAGCYLQRDEYRHRQPVACRHRCHRSQT